MFELFIAKRIYRENNGRSASRPAVLIAMLGVAIGLAVMIVALAIVTGFKKEVRDKVTGFGADIQVTNFDAVKSYETLPIAATDSIMDALRAYGEVGHVQCFSTKPGIIKTDTDFLGMVLKGTGEEYDMTFFRKYLVEGEIPLFTDTAASGKVVVSAIIAGKLKLSLGDKIYTYYFHNDNVRARPLTVAGIYRTNFFEFDKLYLLTDIYTVNRLNGWKDGQVSGMEIKLKEGESLEEATYKIASDTDTKQDAHGGTYFVRNIEQLNPQLFGWLEVLNFNIWIILILMAGVAGFTMISGLLIIIIERTQMIGILKALGAGNYSIRKVFLWLSFFLIRKGMLWGNAIGLSFYLIQSTFGLLKLNPETYYMDTVPVSLNVGVWLLLNVCTLLLSVLILTGPSYLIARINPASSMRYE